MSEQEHSRRARANDTPGESEEETFWRAFYEKLHEIRSGNEGKRLKRMYELLEQKKHLEALGKVITAGAVLFQKEADGIMDEEIEMATLHNEGFTLESHLRYEKDCLKQAADLAANYPAVEAKILELADLMGDPDGKFAKKLKGECVTRQRDMETEKGKKAEKG
jgi:hypothetical protein